MESSVYDLSDLLQCIEERVRAELARHTAAAEKQLETAQTMIEDLRLQLKRCNDSLEDKDAIIQALEDELQQLRSKIEHQTVSNQIRVGGAQTEMSTLVSPKTEETEMHHVQVPSTCMWFCSLMACLSDSIVQSEHRR